MKRRTFIGNFLAVPLALKLDVSKLEENKKIFLTITKEDILKATLIEPGWHKVQIIDVFEKASQVSGDMLIGVVYRTDEGGQITQYLSDKAPQSVFNLLKKCDVDTSDGIADLSDMIGKRIQIEVKSDVYKDRRVSFVKG